MSGSVGAIKPNPSGTVSIAATTGSAQVGLPLGGEELLVYNSGTTLAFVALGVDTSVTASAAGVPIGPGDYMTLACPSTISHVAAVLASGTGTIYFTRCDGTQH